MAKAPRSLTGRVVAITGGARGIGRATAAALIAQGARVAIGDIDAQLAQRTAGELGSGTIGLALDVTDSASFESFVEQTETQLGPVDVLINNAGIMPVGPFVEETEATARRMVDINVHGVITGSKLALRRFTARRSGHLVNIASIAGKSGAPNGATYSATKHAVVGLSESLRQEVRGSGIDVSVVMPIGVNTELYSGVSQLRGLKTPEPEEVAQAIVEALRTGRFEVYVPKVMNATVRMTSLVPRRVADVFGRILRVDQALAAPDPKARAAYETRMVETIAVGERSGLTGDAVATGDAVVVMGEPAVMEKPTEAVAGEPVAAGEAADAGSPATPEEPEAETV